MLQGQRSLPRVPSQAAHSPQNGDDSDQFCCVCHSTEHKLADHPNPNTPEGFLRGCPVCNTTAHSLAQCRRVKPQQRQRYRYHYLRKCREGRCPLEYHHDFREVPNAQGQLTLEHLPLTPEFALANRYPNEHLFKPKAAGGESELISDSFWASGDPQRDAGRFVYPHARFDPHIERELAQQRQQAFNSAALARVENELKKLKERHAAEMAELAELNQQNKALLARVVPRAPAVKFDTDTSVEEQKHNPGLVPQAPLLHGQPKPFKKEESEDEPMPLSAIPQAPSLHGPPQPFKKDESEDESKPLSSIPPMENVCHECKKPGHFRRDCPEAKKASRPDPPPYRHDKFRDRRDRHRRGGDGSAGAALRARGRY